MSVGIDNRPALLKACDAASRYDDGVILWIHGPQPFESDALTEQLLQLWERRPGSLKILAIAADDGRNSILADLEHTGALTVVPRRGTLARDLKCLFTGWTDVPGQQLAAVRRRVPLDSITGQRGSSHIARLWARDEVTRICRTADSRKLPEAAELAAKYQLVTSVSGAVVLENEDQYKQANLKPVDPSSVPSIPVVPEPGSLAALAVGAGSLLAVRWRRRLKVTAD